MKILADTAVPTYTWRETLAIIAVIAGACLVAGVIVLVGRSKMNAQDSSASLVRSWIALSLVLGLILFSGFALGIGDSTLRSTLIGALTASAATAVAFYFSSKGSDQARQDILNVAFGTEVVPNLNGQNENAATNTLGKTSLRLEVDPASPNRAAGTVSAQTPAAGITVRKGSSVVVTLT